METSALTHMLKIIADTALIPGKSWGRNQYNIVQQCSKGYRLRKKCRALLTIPYFMHVEWKYKTIRER